MVAIQLVKRAGATVIATASREEKLERLKPLGLDHPINYANENFVERTNQLTDSRGVEVVLDSIGGQSLIDSVGVLAYRGRLVSVGVAAREGSQVEARSLWTRNNSLHGVFLGGAILSEYARVHPMIGDMLERVANGELQVEIDRSFPLADAAAAHAYAESRKAFGRVKCFGSVVECCRSRWSARTSGVHSRPYWSRPYTLPCNSPFCLNSERERLAGTKCRDAAGDECGHLYRCCRRCDK
ncbi:MAG: zinc-binding dehydrogenase [Solirubrobacteraceae bacterium]